MDFIRNSFSSFFAAFLEYSGGSKIWILYPVALVIILFLGKKEDRKLFIGSFLFQCLTIFNPFLFYFLKQRFQFGDGRYQRLFWVLVFFITIAYAILLVLERIQSMAVKGVALLISAGLILLLGTPAFVGVDGVSQYIPAENIYYVDAEIPALNTIFHSEGLERPKIVYGMLMLYYRQYDPTVTSYFGRNLLYNAEHMTEEEFEKLEGYGKSRMTLAKVYFYHDFSIPVERFCKCLRFAECDYVVSDSDEFDAYLKNGSLTLLGTTSVYRVWKVIK